MTDWRRKEHQMCFWNISVVVIVLALQTCYGKSNQVDEQLVTSVNNFNFNFYRQLIAENKKSFISSPYSAAVALSMLLVGAQTETATEISNTLGYQATGLSIQEVQNVYHKLLSVQNRQNEYFDLSVANSFWVKLGATLLPKYLSAIEKNFFAKGKEVDFSKPSTLSEINEWISKATKGKISKMLDELDPATFLMLINAVYFKGQWEHSFNKSLTRDQEFHNAFSNSIAKVPMMNARGSYKHADIRSLKAQILQLPYKGNEYSMLIILPHDKDGLREVEKKLTAKFINDAITNMYSETVWLDLPRFNLSTTMELNNVLKALGTKLAFKGSADFSGINGNRDLSVSKVIQKAICEVNEEGTVAAAVTVISGTTRSISRLIAFNADHPFLFLIQHTKTGLILFMGRVFEL